MSDCIRITGIRPYDGEYDLDLDEQPFTILEWRWIKKVSGYLPMTLPDGIAGDDPDVYLVFALIALARAGRVRDDEIYTAADRIARSPFQGTIRFVSDTAEVPADDPLPVTPEPTRNGGGSGKQTSDTPDAHPSPTGVPV